MSPLSGILPYTRSIFLATFLFAGSLVQLWAQPDTEVFLARLAREDGRYVLQEATNISGNPGYDNQPFFLSDSPELLYARTRNGQTDIARYNFITGSLQWLSDTPGGGEYSPMPIPDSDAVAAIRLDTTGLQRLYRYQDGGQQVVMEELKIGYQVWTGPDLLVCTVLREDGMDLVVARPSDQSAYTYQKGVGRSLARIPGSPLVSYSSVEDGQTWLKSMDPNSGATERIAPLPEGVQDIAWLPDGSLICGGTNELLRLRPGTDTSWQPWHRFGVEVGHITRLAVRENGGYLALVAQKPEAP